MHPDDISQHSEERQVRSLYRDLLRSTETEKHVLIQGDIATIRNNMLKANSLFEHVKSTQDAALDSALLLMTSDITTQKIQKMTMGSGFSFDDYIANLQRIVGTEDGFKALRQRVSKFACIAPKTNFMFGPIEIQPKKAAARTPRQKLVKDASKLQVTKELQEEDIEKDENETSANVEMVYKVLQRVEPIELFSFFINPESFSQSVENLFYISFLIRDSKAAIDETDDGDLVISTSDPPTEEDMKENDCSKLQNIFHFDMNTWRKLIQIYEIEKTVIPHRKPVKNATASTWYG